MAQLIADFFQVIEMQEIPAENLTELIPYLFSFVVACFLVSCVFRVLGKIMEIFVNFRRW